MRFAFHQFKFEIDGNWRRPDWPEREMLTGFDSRDIGVDLVLPRTSGKRVAILSKSWANWRTPGRYNEFVPWRHHPIC